MLHPIIKLGAMLVHLGHVWEARNIKMDWLEMEETLVDILNLTDDLVDDKTKLKLVKECIDAFTKRGHFVHD